MYVAPPVLLKDQPQDVTRSKGKLGAEKKKCEGKKRFHRVTQGNEMCTWGRAKHQGVRRRRASSSNKWRNNERE